MNTPARRAGPASLLAMIVAVAVGVAAGCQVDREAFHRRLFSCNPSAADPACGTDGDERPMACVAAYQLGGRNFCASGCNPKTAPPDGDGAGICLPSGPRDKGDLSGARLRVCAPEGPGGGCGDEELSCLRTDLLRNEGVCMSITSCARHADCRDPVRSVCMGELLRQTYGDEAGLRADHTYCLQGGCRANRTSCSPGETCLKDVIPRRENPSDICVPNCDANRNCPPNYFCYPELYSAAAPPVCIPGLLGFRCKTRLQCLFGDCADTGAGFSVCALPCEDDRNCEKFDGDHGTFVCAPGADGRKLCQAPRAYRGGLCTANADCRPGETCARLRDDLPTGQCLHECGADLSCPAYGGLPHSCLPQIAGKGNPVCWPGQFGVPCRSDDHCLGGLTCRSTDPRDPKALRICTTGCQRDDDCARDRFAKEGGGWCQPQLGICLPPLPDDDERCERSEQCESRRCVPAPASKTGRRCDRTQEL